MGFIWRPFGLIAVAGGLVAWGLALALLVSGASRRGNRRLAAALFLDGVYFLCAIGLPYFTDDPRLARSLIIVGEVTLCIMGWAYLSFLGTVESTWARPFRRHGPMIAAIGSGLTLLGYYRYLYPMERVPIDLIQEGVPLAAWGLQATWEGAPPVTDLIGVAVQLFAAAVVLASSVYGLLVVIHAWLKGAPDGPARRRNRLMAIAFGIRDGGILFGFIVAPTLLALLSPWLGMDGLFAGMRLVINAPVFAELLFIPVVVYAMLRSQVLHLELRLKRGIGPGFVVFLGTTGFIIVSEVIESLLTRNAGLLAGLATATAIGLAFVPLQRAGNRLARRWLPHVEDSEDYRARRRQEVYRDAFEAVLQDGRIQPHERVALSHLAQRLGIPDEATQRIEDDIMPAVRMPAAVA